MRGVRCGSVRDSLDRIRNARDLASNELGSRGSANKGCRVRVVDISFAREMLQDLCLGLELNSFALGE